MDIILSLAHPGRQQVSVSIIGTNEITHTWSLYGRAPFKMPLSVIESPQDDGHNAQVNV